MSGVIVTGAGSGIGLACAELLVEQDVRVTLWDVAPRVTELAERLGMPYEVVDVSGDLGPSVARRRGPQRARRTGARRRTVAVEPVGSVHRGLLNA